MNPSPLPVVADASVGVKWVLQEEDADRARALLRDCARMRRPVYAPPHFLSEVVNVIYQRLRSTDPRIHITDDEANRAVAEFLEIAREGVELVASTELYEQAYSFAKTYAARSLYDSLYVVLAQMLGAELWTADQRLVKAVGSSLRGYGLSAITAKKVKGTA